MNSNLLIAQGNQHRSDDQYQQALRCYAEAFLIDPDNKDAWNNYGNVLREIGEPKRAIPFLQHACAIDPNFVTAQFNIAIASLLAGDYELGWNQYEWRWQYEHLAGSKPNFQQPEWQGQDLKGKTILVVAEQGFGDVIQFSRFLYDLHLAGAEILFLTMPGLVPLFQPSFVIKQCVASSEQLNQFDYWVPMMSLPKILGTNLQNIRHDLAYIASQPEFINTWSQRLGTKKQMRIGVCWSGRKDNWVNRYKSFPVQHIIDLAQKFPQHDWINLQAEMTDDETSAVHQSNIVSFPGAISHWADTAGLVHHLDLVVSMDTSVAHLAASMGKPTWIPLTKFAVDWRWGTVDDTTPWYPTARLFRQSDFGDWHSVFQQLAKYIDLFKI